MELLLDSAAGSLGYIWGTDRARPQWGMPRMIFLLQPNIEESLNPVRRPMQLGLHSRTLAWEKCRANINVRSTEFNSFETISKTLSRTTKECLIGGQSAISPRDIPQRGTCTWPQWGDRVSEPWCAGEGACTSRVSRLLSTETESTAGRQPCQSM
jgi:hypothetical protein